MTTKCPGSSLACVGSSGGRRAFCRSAQPAISPSIARVSSLIGSCLTSADALLHRLGEENRRVGAQRGNVLRERGTRAARAGKSQSVDVPVRRAVDDVRIGALQHALQGRYRQIRPEEDAYPRAGVIRGGGGRKGRIVRGTRAG